MVFLEHGPRVALTYHSSRSHGTAVCRATCKVRNYYRPRDPGSWQKMAATPDDCERTATVALPTAASPGFISGDLGTSAAIDAVSTVYELPLTRFENRQTDEQTRWCSYNTDLAWITYSTLTTRVEAPPLLFVHVQQRSQLL